jgi:hypothetical protein
MRVIDRNREREKEEKSLYFNGENGIVFITK